ncbi:hypothetical protein [Rossellomorea marisflavi]|uniref:Uncharacterized protein n=1 Tax=Rossellomorea marisflavi TaxID=189381 RepID=A0A0J5V330_9BACI|nr:hypothetical protein [Rossellomorea marisflavi]KMK91769.1 hypothetical protein VL03_17530 [Rossellomorea marisflavi]KML05007.1 hypothetical protein VL06_11755 [Rossellomorea marisflavi]KML35107.1 hypothetical protein VL12_02800 [Rossellomorea marisflavi]KZE48040.1 hypothetical protein AV649_20145 [Rossellomorea marisflavi]
MTKKGPIVLELITKETAGPMVLSSTGSRALDGTHLYARSRDKGWVCNLWTKEEKKKSLYQHNESPF